MNRRYQQSSKPTVSRGSLAQRCSGSQLPLLLIGLRNRAYGTSYLTTAHYKSFQSALRRSLFAQESSRRQIKVAYNGLGHNAAMSMELRASGAAVDTASSSKVAFDQATAAYPLRFADVQA